MADLSVSELEKTIKDILKGADLSNLSTKKVRKTLEEKFETDLTSRKKEIDKMVMRLITENEEEEEEEKKKSEDKDDGANGISDGSDAELEEDEKVPKKKKQEKSSTAATKAQNKRKSASKADDSEDPVMSSIREMGDEDLAKRLQEEESGLRTRGSRRAALNPPKPKKRKEQDPEKKKKSVYSRPCHLSEDLAAVVGANEMPRPEVVKTLWSIVKERNLQDPQNKQFIICDEQLEKVFGHKRIKAFGMMKFLKKHIKDFDK